MIPFLLEPPSFNIIFFVVAIVVFHSGYCQSATLSFKAQTYWCPGARYAENSTFQSNLNALLSSLSKNSLSTNFYNDTTGDGLDRVYGLYFCTGDLPQSDCRNCILTASSDILQLCPTNRQGIVWYDYCQLRYSDEYFFGVMDARGSNLSNPFARETDPSRPVKVVAQLVEQAPSMKNFFAYSESETDKIYALAQCTSDLSRTDCANCLAIAFKNITSCCTQSQGWRFLGVSCWIRYEATPFLKNIQVPTEIVDSRCSNDNFESSISVRANANLHQLLSSLPSNGGRTGFYNTTIGLNSDRLYGLVLCRPDLNYSDACHNCLNKTSNTVLRSCANKTEGIVWYEECFLRYSNHNFFGIVDHENRTFCNEQETTREADETVIRLMSGLVDIAPNHPLMFAAGNVSISSSLSSCGLVQCTRDLGSDSCRNCLTDGMSFVSSICKQKKGWRYLSSSCNLRYEDFAFYDASILSSLPFEFQPSVRGPRGKHSKIVTMVIIVSLIIGIILLSFYMFVMWRRKTRKQNGHRLYGLDDPDSLSDTDLHMMDIAILQAATNNFSDVNKLGEGGFGPVYKGVLPDGKEIAIKRLSSTSTQGSEEFKNEVILIAKLQHRNLVRVLGCCIQGEEKLLVYEYLPNRSLDNFLFSLDKHSPLDWNQRLHIIFGITRGLVYLHEDSQLKIIHRDLKASNILLDHKMNPKISDFGTSRIFSHDQNEANTNRVVGTYGYMAPEFAMAGLFSVKSDVFSFGVLLLEIVSGQKNGGSHFLLYGQSLIRRAWELWTEGKGLEIIDPLILGSCVTSEALRCIHIGLLCVQENATDRPTMSSVLHMLRSEHVALQEPGRPPSFMGEAVSGLDNSPASGTKSHSVNEMTVSDFLPR